ncbi:unnamed protein product [Cunninghamella echinulata]
MNSIQMTIDYNIPELNAILSVFPNTIIRFCIFHVIQAWNRKLNDKVRLTNATKTETVKYKGDMLNCLRSTVHVSDMNTFSNAVHEFCNKYQAQEKFIDYFKKEWLANERKIRIWSCEQDRLLNRLIYIIINYVDYDTRADRDRITQILVE